MKKLVIGVDIGGSIRSSVLVDRTGEVCAIFFSYSGVPFFDDYSAYVEMLLRTLQELCAAMPAGAVLSGIGIGAPNANYHTGRIERPVNLWKFRSGEPNPEEGRFFSLCKECRQTLFPDSRPYYQRRQCRRSRGDRLRQCRGNAGFHHGNAWNRVGIGIRCRRSDDLRARWHGRRAGACRRRTRGRQCGCGRRGCLKPMFPRRVSSGRFSS